MSAVVDTNILLYYILKSEPFFEESRSFLKEEKELMAPDVWRTEMLNAIWLACRSNALAREDALDYLSLVANMITRTVPSEKLWMDALHLAIEARYSPYNTLFVALARRENTQLVTFDERTLNLFPRIARRPGEFLENRGRG